MTFTIIIRSIIIYTIVLFLVRLMGKRQIGEMQPFELVITLVFADLATIPMADTALPLIHGIIPLLALVLLHYLFSFLTRKSLFFRKLLNGKPVILIGPNGIDFKALRKLNMNFNDLIEGLRSCNYFNIEEVLYAIMQTNGSLAVLPRAPYAPVTADDLKIKKETVSLPIVIISKGKLLKDNAKLAEIDENFVNNAIKNTKIRSISSILFATLNQHGTLYIQPNEGEFITITTDYKGDGKW